MTTGEIGILNVGAGDTKIVFDPRDAAETAKAKRIVQDMLRRGYAFLIEVEEGGRKVTRRVLRFRPEVCEYIIDDGPAAAPEPAAKPGKRAVSAFGTTGVAVARAAGG